MKVLFNNETAELYRPLFTAAMEVLNKDKPEEEWITIEDLPTYYSHLDTLKTQGQARFVRVPVVEQEGYFEIDTNTREIKVPDAFKENGIAVQFDHTAEIIYFNMDRYFDDFDLAVCNPANAQEGYVGRCMIQWQTANGFGYDKAYMFDEGSDVEEDGVYAYNRITFGWPLHDEITRSSGSLKFSVILEVVENDVELNSKVLYSFNTKEAECFIHPNLVPRAEDYKKALPEDVSALMSSALRPSFSGVFNSTLGQKAYFLTDGDLPPTANLVDGAYILEVQARGTGDQELLYKWYRINENDEITELTGSVESSYIADTAGRYYVMVGNQNKDRVRWTQSQICDIPGASELYYIVNTSDKAYADGTILSVEVGGMNKKGELLNNIVGEVSYQWYKRDWDGEVSALEGETTAYHTLDAKDGPGTYWVEAVAHNNNDSSEIKKSFETEVKLPAHSPTSVTVEWDVTNKKLIAHPVIDYNNDLVYVWEQIGSSQAYVVKDFNEFIPPVSGSYYVRVYQNTWPGHPMEQTSESLPAISGAVAVTL
ncbi:MAG: hypothetical protein E7270_01080 [Lachnospiraceae bacterium]|nr:hypothetical protein [Lachnospiraceae bacterium]